MPFPRNLYTSHNRMPWWLTRRFLHFEAYAGFLLLVMGSVIAPLHYWSGLPEFSSKGFIALGMGGIILGMALMICAGISYLVKDTHPRYRHIRESDQGGTEIEMCLFAFMPCFKPSHSENPQHDEEEVELNQTTHPLMASDGSPSHLKRPPTQIAVDPHDQRSFLESAADRAGACFFGSRSPRIKF